MTPTRALAAAAVIALLAPACAGGGGPGEPEAQPDASPAAEPDPTPDPTPEPQPGDATRDGCAHAFDCGGTYYGDTESAYVDNCVDAAVGYWGDCASRIGALDAYNTCFAGLSCADIGNPDAYNPSGTPCADAYQALGDSEPCP